MTDPRYAMGMAYPGPVWIDGMGKSIALVDMEIDRLIDLTEQILRTEIKLGLLTPWGRAWLDRFQAELARRKAEAQL